MVRQGNRFLRETSQELMGPVLCYARGQLSVAQLGHGALVLRRCDTLRDIKSFREDKLSFSRFRLLVSSLPGCLFMICILIPKMRDVLRWRLIARYGLDELLHFNCKHPRPRVASSFAVSLCGTLSRVLTRGAYISANAFFKHSMRN
jgi:hypothetical protein